MVKIKLEHLEDKEIEEVSAKELLAIAGGSVRLAAELQNYRLLKVKETSVRDVWSEQQPSEETS